MLLFEANVEQFMNDPTHVDLAFVARGGTIVKDHGYALYGALCRAIPDLHGARWLGIHGIAARVSGPNELALASGGTLRVRIPVERVPMLLALAGRQIEIRGRPIVIGPPSIVPLEPVEVLDARLVIIKLTGGARSAGQCFDRAQFETRFIAEATRQLERLGVSGTIELCGRASTEVGGRRVIGYAVRVRDLSADHSITLQVIGLGGKRAMGCGLFRRSRVHK